MLSPKLVLIDLDGTLVDSVPDLAFAIDEMMRQLHMPARGEDAVRHWVGNGMQRLVERALSNDIDGYPNPALFARGMPLFMAAYAQNTCQHSRLYAGVLEGLDFLQSCQGLKIGCVTNKAAQFTQPLLTTLGLIERFEIVISGDTLAEKKPHPLPLLYAAEHFGVTPAESLMIGDSRSDVQAARAAGFKVICMSYGYNHGEDIRNYHPDAVIHSMTELPQYIDCLAV